TNTNQPMPGLDALITSSRPTACPTSASRIAPWPRPSWCPPFASVWSWCSRRRSLRRWRGTSGPFCTRSQHWAARRRWFSFLLFLLLLLVCFLADSPRGVARRDPFEVLGEQDLGEVGAVDGGTGHGCWRA